MKTLFVILDGLGDHPNKKMGNKTPLEAAKKPNINKLARNAENGVVDIIDRGIIPGSDTGHLSLFGYDIEKYYIGRGSFEALGSDIELEEGDLSFRVNFATVKDNIIVDRRINRNDYGLEEILNDFKDILEKIEKEYGVKIILKKGVEHRGVLVIKGVEGYNVTENDLHEEGIEIRKIEGLDKKSKETAEILNRIIEEFNKFSEKHEKNKERKENGLNPINYILIRGRSVYKPLNKEDLFENRYKINGIFLAAPPMYLGVAKYVGLDIEKPLGTNGTSNENLFSFSNAALRYRDKYDIVFVHIKGTDSLSHDKKPEEKKKFIERVDNEIFGRLKDEFDIIVLTGDHSTSSILGRHTSDPVPIMIYSENSRFGFVKDFGERKCMKGTLGRIYGKDIMKILLDKTNKGIMIGT